MPIIADLHLHSKYSRAVSQNMDLEEIARWAKRKGIDLVATGDWTHPLWFREIKTKLKESSPGIFQLNGVKFLLSTEVSSIYKQNNKIHRIHNLILSPSLETSEKIIKKLTNQGVNLLSDGRPIMGISSKNLLELILEIDKNCLLIPAHVWTPWFSLYGSKSGFDSIKECFGEYSQYIYAVETGLSSDPIMNWQIKELEDRSIVSFSDAHSGPKLGREATVFITTNKQTDKKGIEFSYQDIINAIKQLPNSKLKIGYTIEFFPEEGKYHWSGHRQCHIRYSPEELRKKGSLCPICHKPLTIGVENRVIDLSSKTYQKTDLLFLENTAQLTFVYDKERKHRPFVSLIPLIEILTEINNGSSTKALTEYQKLTEEFASEFDILMKKSFDEIEQYGGLKLRQAMEILRKRKVIVDPGYDGVFGKIKVFENNNALNQKNLEEEKQPTLF